ncbi:cysteine peptidase family C39 domain-containing protein [Pedobacter sp. Leaf194]|uniref:cysteine peptidase family C39 domain-containing protein n=1 Tax=Pedobacter sp. Leaf194 TaxID=1736297 RepID=UPI000702DF8D|nr:cysteine peptidase family C39 domain-containing protein [Pedobacter sp. Leaf194]KQS36817.1 hypothetical protein ASG14_07205 [Pedobacter sp. Leaf194]
MISSRFYSNNSTWVTFRILQILNIQANSFTVKKIIESHPDFSSLLSISDTLQEFKVKSTAFLVKKEEFNSKGLSFPFIAHLPENGGEFVIVNKIVDENVHLENQKNGKFEIPQFEFINKWEGVSLYPTISEKSAERDYRVNQVKNLFYYSKFVGLMILLTNIFYLLIADKFFFYDNNLALGLKLGGIVITSVLLFKSVSFNNPLVNMACGILKNGNCDSVLTSPASRLTSWLSWSEVGFYYFFGTFLCLVINPELELIVKLINLLSLPYTVYSIRYQFKNKSWCILCCGVQIVLWLEAWNFSLSSHAATQLNLRIFLEVLWSFSIPVVFWSGLKLISIKSQEVVSLTKQLNKIKFNTPLFIDAISKEPKNVVDQAIFPIVIGNSKAQTTVTIVSNPYCRPCAEAHIWLSNWLEGRNDIKIEIIFAVTDNKNDVRNIVAKHMIALSRMKDPEVMRAAIDEWYKKQTNNYENWINRYPVNYELDANEVIKAHRKWCNSANITSTPTILINGQKLPEPFILSDIKYLIN